MEVTLNKTSIQMYDKSHFILISCNIVTRLVFIQTITKKKGSSLLTNIILRKNRDLVIKYNQMVKIFSINM
jgi:hypothetical protein